MTLYIGKEKVTPILKTGEQVINNQDKTITENGTYIADIGYTGLGTVKVEVSEYPEPTDTIGITSNGIVNVKDFATADVRVPEKTFTTQEKIVTDNGVVTPDSGYDGLSKVTVNVDKGIKPTGNINITNTSTVDVTNYATAKVVDSDLISSNIKKNVNILGVTGTYEGITPTGTKTINANGTYDVTNYANAIVNVEGGEGSGVKIEPEYETEFYKFSTYNYDFPLYVPYKDIIENENSNITVTLPAYTDFNVYFNINLDFTIDDNGELYFINHDSDFEVITEIYLDSDSIFSIDSTYNSDTGESNYVQNYTSLGDGIVQIDFDNDTLYCDLKSSYTDLYTDRACTDTYTEEVYYTSRSFIYDSSTQSYVNYLDYSGSPVELTLNQNYEPIFDAYIIGPTQYTNTVQFYFDGELKGDTLVGFAGGDLIYESPTPIKLGHKAFQYAFSSELRYKSGDTYISYPIPRYTKIEFKNVVDVSSTSLSGICYGNKNIKTFNMPDVKHLINMQQAFGYASSLNSVNFDSLEIAEDNCFNLAFTNCASLQTIRFPKLKTIGESCFYSCFGFCTNLKHIYFDALMPESLDYSKRQFALMLAHHTSGSFGSVNGCTVHLPASVESIMSTWEYVINGFGGRNTVVLYDL